MLKNIDRLGKSPLVVVGVLIVVLSLNSSSKVDKERQRLLRIEQEGVNITAQKGKIIEHKDNKQSVRYLFMYDDDKYLLETEPTYKGKGQTPDEREFKLILDEPDSYYDMTVPPNPSSFWSDICLLGGLGLLGYLGFDAFKNRPKRKQQADTTYDIPEVPQSQPEVQPEEDFDIDVNSPFSGRVDTPNFGNIDSQTVSRMRSGERARPQSNGFNNPRPRPNQMDSRPYDYSQNMNRNGHVQDQHAGNNNLRRNPTQGNLRREPNNNREESVNTELFGSNNTPRKDLRRR